MTIETDISEMKTDIENIGEWQRTHDRSHNVHGDRLNIILDEVTTHNSNHHSVKSRIQEGGLITVALAMIATLGELSGLWDLLSRFV